MRLLTLLAMLGIIATCAFQVSSTGDVDHDIARLKQLMEQLAELEDKRATADAETYEDVERAGKDIDRLLDLNHQRRMQEQEAEWARRAHEQAQKADDDYSELYALEREGPAAEFDAILERHLNADDDVAEREFHDDVHALKTLQGYLKSSPTLAARSQVAIKYLAAVREYKRVQEEKRGPISERDLRVELSAINVRNPRVRRIELHGDQELPKQFLNGQNCLVIDRICDNVRFSKYRTFDGSCNNLVRGQENFGSLELAFKRRYEPEFGDGFFSPRQSRDPNRPLPTAREVSIAVNAAGNINRERSPVNSLHMMQVGQFLDHDLTHAPAQGGVDGTNVPCECNQDPDDNCFPLPLEPGHDLAPCIRFRRSLPLLNDQCDLDRFEQANSLTAWIDSSQVYGMSLENATALRDQRTALQFGRVHGRLLTRTNPVSHDPFDQLLPRFSRCPTAPICTFFAGDFRINEQPGLASMHHLFVLLHNFFEKNFAKINPGWDGETLFQETRKLATEVWQNIALNEYLIIILGPTAHTRYGIARTAGGYNNMTNPNIANGFAAAAMRFGHSEIRDIVPFVNSNFGGDVETELRQQFEGRSPGNLYNSPVSDANGVDALLLGLADRRANRIDSLFTQTIREDLFSEEPGIRQGLDLIALNIQRARDHGVPGYLAALRFCGLPLNANNLRPETRQPLLDLYGNGVDNLDTLSRMDLFAAGMSETPVADGNMGPTFTCLLGTQFGEIKNGDRFYYGFEDAGRTPAQIANIESYLLSSVLCDSLPDAVRMQPQALLRPFTSTPNDAGLQAIFGPNFNNARVPCSSLPKIDWSLFADPHAAEPNPVLPGAGEEEVVELDPSVCPAGCQQVIACERGPAIDLDCGLGTIDILYANYGRTQPDPTVCPLGGNHGNVTNCVSVSSRQQVLDACQHQRSCSFAPLNSVFGDPCRGTFKYLEIIYECNCQAIKEPFP